MSVVFLNQPTYIYNKCLMSVFSHGSEQRRFGEWKIHPFACQAKFKATGEAQARTTSPFINPEAFSYQRTFISRKGGGIFIAWHPELLLGENSAQGLRSCSKTWLNWPPPRRDHPKSHAFRLAGTPPSPASALPFRGVEKPCKGSASTAIQPRATRTSGCPMAAFAGEDRGNSRAQRGSFCLLGETKGKEARRLVRPREVSLKPPPQTGWRDAAPLPSPAPSVFPLKEKAERGKRVLLLLAMQSNEDIMC